MQQTVIKVEVRNNLNYDYDEGHNDGNQERFYWNELTGSRFHTLIHDAYKKTIQWKRNMFILPTGASGKEYINETMHLFNLWVYNTPYESIAQKAIQMMLPLLLRKLSKSSKSQEHLEAKSWS